MNEIVKSEPRELAQADPMSMLQSAIDRGMSGEDLSKMMDLADRWEATQARKSFVRAMTAFKENPPTITKNKHVSYESRSGVMEYDHATHDHVCDTIGRCLSEHGITHRWTVAQDGDRVKVTCILTHVDGHSESVSMQSGADGSGGKNGIQAIGSAVTYLQRYTLQAITGMSAKDRDDDGKAAGKSLETITESQAADLQALIDEAKADKAGVLKYAKAGTLTEVLAEDFDKIVSLLRQKARGNA